MKLELDYINRTIKVTDYTSLEKFVNVVKEILPDWKTWKIVPNTNTEYVPYYPVYPTYPTTPTYPSWEPIIISYI